MFPPPPNLILFSLGVVEDTVGETLIRVEGGAGGGESGDVNKLGDNPEGGREADSADAEADVGVWVEE
jgi:hypothetical protein